MFKKIASFLRSVRQEMTYVSWPTRADLQEGTTAVIVMSIIVAIFLSLIDALFGYIIRTLLFKG
ncbi:MAG: preprotein translocase subunit SecE [Candidatus Cloacimonetes bacterium]|nr:preprotein translocase subunit SecE [Candidatus Cloacimonadota bacterium]